MRGAADEVLATLKDEHFKEKEKHREVSNLLGTISDERYAMLGGLGRKITDYGQDKQASAGGSATHFVASWTHSCMILFQ